MSDISIVTQQELKPIKSALRNLAENLDAHVSDTISKAHGINLFPGLTEFDPGSGGNDLTRYFDSNGDEVGNRMLQIIANGTVAYVPCKDTTLVGQPLGTGSIPTGTPAEAESFTGAGPASWVTAFAKSTEEEIEAVSNLLLQHTADPQATVHGGIQILPEITLDSRGHTIGDRVVTIVINGVKYKMPASSKLGGPFQSPRNVVLSPAHPSIRVAKEESNTVNVPFTTTATGTKPFSYQYQVLQGTTWVDIPPGVSIVVTYTSTVGGNGSVRLTWAGPSTGLLTIVKIFPGSGTSASMFMRCAVTNASGTGISNESQIVQHDES